MLHGGCNMACPFCVTDTRVAPMTRHQARALVHDLARSGFRGVVLGGGEPFAWPWLIDVARHAQTQGLEVQVGTNGVQLPAGYTRLHAIDRFVLPLESTHAPTHDRMRPLAGRSHYALIFDRLAALRSAGRQVTVSTVVTAENLDGLPALGARLAAYQAGGGRLHAWHLYRFIPEGRGGARHAGRFHVDEAVYHAAADAVREAQPTVRIFKRPDMYHSRDVEFFWYEASTLRIGSQAWAVTRP
ncbi:MAG: radical SAM protein [Candidatus Hydrogenedentota bacterium]